jgi:hypothetical protein
LTLLGRPLVILAGVATLVVAAATVLLWRRRLLTVRIAGLLLVEVLLVATVGLQVNRHEKFYPSWRALTGDTGTATRTAPVTPARLDASLAADGRRDVLWQPAGAAAWRLAEPPRLLLPDGYVQRPAVRFPVIVALVPSAQAAAAEARQVRDAVVVVLVPTGDTTAGSLRDLPPALAGDVRVTADGWALVAAGPLAALGDAFAAAQPPGLVTVRGWQPDQLAVPLTAPQLLPPASVAPPS